MELFSKEEKQRYARQILRHGIEGQLKLKQAKVCVVGAGGIGSPLLQYLVASGIGTIFLFENDKVEMSNLARQILYRATDISKEKGHIAVQQLNANNPHVSIQWLNTDCTAEKILTEMPRPDIILEGSDDLNLKFSLSRSAIQNQIPLLIGAIAANQSHIFPVPFEFPKFQGCYECLFPRLKNTDEIPSCASEGIISPMAGIIGTHMAHLAYHFLVYGKMPNFALLFENLKSRNLNLNLRGDCPVCSS